MSLSFGAMIPDIEVIPIMLISGEGEHARGLMHSILGALTFDILMVMFFVYFLVPPVGKWFKHRFKEKLHIFAGEDITLAPKNLGWALVSALIGTVSHIFIDVFTHTYNPLFWPYMTQQNYNWLLFPDNLLLSSMVFMIPLGIIVLALALRYWTRPFNVKK